MICSKKIVLLLKLRLQHSVLLEETVGGNAGTVVGRTRIPSGAAVDDARASQTLDVNDARDLGAVNTLGRQRIKRSGAATACESVSVKKS